MLTALNPQRALLSSLAVIGPAGLDPHDVIHLMNLSTYAVTYNSLDIVLYRSMLRIAATVWCLLSSQVSSAGSSGNTSASAMASWTYNTV